MSKMLRITLATAICFAVIFGLIGLHLLTSSRAATPQSTQICTSQPAPLSTCRPLIGAATYGNPGTPSDPLPANEIDDSDFQFSYLESLIGSQFKFNVYRDYHCVYGGTPCTGSSSSLSSTDIKYANAGDYLNINWIPSPNWSVYPVSSSSTGPAQAIYGEIVQAANSFKSISPTPIYLTVWHEMNLHVTDSGVSGCQANGSGGIGTPQQFIAAWQNIYNIFQAQGVKNVVWTMNYAGVHIAA